jgi:RNA polymerase-binding transcription factor DksA
MATKTVQKKKVAKKPVAAAVKSPAKAAKPVAKKAVSAPKATTKPSAKGAKPVSKPAAKGAKPVAKVVKPVAKVAVKPVAKPQVKSQVDKKSLQILKDALIKMRDRLTGQITALADDSLKYIDDASSEDRTDDFDREFALNLVSSEHDSVFEINSALRRIEDGIYGVCDSCSCQIEKPRLHALPFARMCIKCQSEQEKGRSRFRPFGESLAQGVEPLAETVEAEETE